MAAEATVYLTFIDESSSPIIGTRRCCCQCGRPCRRVKRSPGRLLGRQRATATGGRLA